MAIGLSHIGVASGQARPGRAVCAPEIKLPATGTSRIQVHVQADGGASRTGADLDQVAHLLDDP